MDIDFLVPSLSQDYCKLFVYNWRSCLFRNRSFIECYLQERSEVFTINQCILVVITAIELLIQIIPLLAPFPSLLIP